MIIEGGISKINPLRLRTKTSRISGFARVLPTGEIGTYGSRPWGPRPERIGDYGHKRFWIDARTVFVGESASSGQEAMGGRAVIIARKPPSLIATEQYAPNQFFFSRFFKRSDV